MMNYKQLYSNTVKPDSSGGASAFKDTASSECDFFYKLSYSL